MMKSIKSRLQITINFLRKIFYQKFRYKCHVGAYEIRNVLNLLTKCISHPSTLWAGNISLIYCSKSHCYCREKMIKTSRRENTELIRRFHTLKHSTYSRHYSTSYKRNNGREIHHKWIWWIINKSDRLLQVQFLESHNQSLIQQLVLFTKNINSGKWKIKFPRWHFNWICDQ